MTQNIEEDPVLPLPASRPTHDKPNSNPCLFWFMYTSEKSDESLRIRPKFVPISYKKCNNLGPNSEWIR